jgi:O-antigen/teichoic acid export membrane protein
MSGESRDDESGAENRVAAKTSPSISSAWIRQAWGYHAAALTAGAVSVASTPFVARILTPEAFGIADSQIQLAAATSIFATLGLDSAIGRAFLDERDQARQAGFVTLGLTRLLQAGAVAGAILGLVFFAVMPRFAAGTLLALAVAAVVPLAMAESFLRNVARWRSDLWGYSLLLVLSSGVKAGFGVVLSRWWGGPGLVAGYLAGAAVSVGVGLVRHRRFIGREERPESRPLYRYGAPLMLASFAATFGVSAERWLALTLVSAPDLGQLVGATKIASLYVMLAEGLRQSWSPATFTAWRDPTFAAQYSEALGRMALLIGGMVGGLSAFAPEIAALALGRNFSGAAVLVPCLTLAYGFQDMGRFVSIGLHRSMRGATQAGVAWGSTAVWILLAAALALPWGISGFVLANAVASLAGLLVNGRLSHRELPLIYPVARFGMGGFLALGGIAISGAPLPVKVLLAALAFAFLVPHLIGRGRP